jgi:hypothetical protein
MDQTPEGRIALKLDQIGPGSGIRLACLADFGLGSAATVQVEELEALKSSDLADPMDVENSMVLNMIAQQRRAASIARRSTNRRQTTSTSRRKSSTGASGTSNRTVNTILL